jgi:hypothetical protein
MTVPHATTPFREGPIDAPPRMRSSPAPWIALGSAIASFVFALAGLWTVVAKGLFDRPSWDAAVPTVCAFALVLASIAAIRRARNVTPHRNRTRAAIVFAVLAFAIDVLAIATYVEAIRRPPPPPWPTHGSDHPPINLCGLPRGDQTPSSGGSIGPAIGHMFC